jgi:fumarylacetoacetate (FAA) hydrolase
MEMSIIFLFFTHYASHLLSISLHMKLATLKDGSRDGQLAMVSRDLKHIAIASHIAPTMQRALDDWAFIAPQLEALSLELNQGRARNAVAFDPAQCMAPLPRAYQWADGSAYVNHVELVRKARKADMPDTFWTDPLMYQGAGDDFIGPTDDIPLASEAWGIDFEAEVAVVLDDVPMQTKAADALEHVRLITILNDVSLRNLIPAELAKGFGFFHGKATTAFAPVAVTPDELGGAWQAGKVHLPLRVHWNGNWFGHPNAGVDMVFDFAQLIQHAAKTRNLRSGTVLGSGTISNKDASQGYCCIAEVRAIEMIAADGGKPTTEFMKFGDRVRIEMLDAGGQSIFGAIDQKVVKA